MKLEINPGGFPPPTPSAVPKARLDRPLPFAAKIAASGFLAVLLPVYWHTYGPTNFLWFCDAALILTVAGMWLESSLLISLCAVGILLPQTLWLLDYGLHLLGGHCLGLTDYMFDPRLPLFTRGLSLFHGWLPVLLVWLLVRLGYDRRALNTWTLLAAGLLLAGTLFGLPAGAHPTNPNTPVNLNYAYGFNDRQPQSWVNQKLYVGLWLGTLWLVVFLPTHLVLQKIFAVSVPVGERKFGLQLLGSSSLVGLYPIATGAGPEHHGNTGKGTGWTTKKTPLPPETSHETPSSTPA